MYVGIDIAKLNHFASVVSSDGKVLVEPFKFDKSLFFGLLRLHIEADRLLEPKLSHFIYTLNLMVQC